MKVAVFVLTTRGPVRIERIQREVAPQSAVCLQRTTRTLPISAAYDAFVRAPSGVIEREFGPFEPGGFRLDLSAEIDDGDSWQLGFYLAHALERAGSLARPTEDADAHWFTTGALDNDLRVRAVDHVAEKAAAAEDMIAAAAAGGPVTIFVPAANAAAAQPLERDRVATVAVENARSVLISSEQSPSAASAIGGVARATSGRPRLAIGLVVALAFTLLFAAIKESDSPEVPPAAAQPAATEVVLGEIAIATSGLFPPPGQSCSAIAFGEGLERPLAASDEAGIRRFELPSDACGIEIALMPIVPRYLLVRHITTSGKFARRAAWPREFDGAQVVGTPVRWRAMLPRRALDDLDYALVIGWADVPLSRPAVRSVDDPLALAAQFRSLGASVEVVRFRVTRR